MAATEMHSAYLDLLFDNLRGSQFPSGTLLDKTEAALTADRAEEYIELLLERCRGPFPSLDLLDRVHAVIQGLAEHEAR